jgi:hypothetical protein
MNFGILKDLNPASRYHSFYIFVYLLYFQMYKNQKFQKIQLQRKIVLFPNLDISYFPPSFRPRWFQDTTLTKKNPKHAVVPIGTRLEKPKPPTFFSEPSKNK